VSLCDPVFKKRTTGATEGHRGKLRQYSYSEMTAHNSQNSAREWKTGTVPTLTMCERCWGDSEGATGNSTSDGNHRTPGHAEPYDQEYSKYSDCSNRDSLEKGKEKET
jgi:hypothetical protein